MDRKKEGWQRRIGSALSELEALKAGSRREGKGRQYKKEFIQFLHIARGSVFEVVTVCEVFRRRKLFLEEDANEIRKRCEQIDRKLNGLINSLRGNKRRSTAV